MISINLNADLGEECGDDLAMLEVVGAANIACGGHAGTPATMEATVLAALARGIDIGAHPSYADHQGFGRRPMDVPPEGVEALVRDQTEALAEIAARLGGRVSHVKPHGALNNRAAMEAEAAEAVARAVRAVDSGLILLAPAGSAMVRAGRAQGLAVAEEVFADRAYDDQGNLAPRSQPGAVIHDPDAAASRVLAMLREGALTALSGRKIPCVAHSVCVHGDDAGAVALARRLRSALEQAGISLTPLSRQVLHRDGRGGI